MNLAPASLAYRIVRPLLFALDAERAHELALALLRVAGTVPGACAALGAMHRVADPRLACQRFGLAFANPLGLAAGFDKNARVVRGLAALGFGCVEVGTLTPRPQPGNPRPRMFRLPEHGAVINRLGFNNRGVAAAAACLARGRRPKGLVLGVNVGKNKDTPDAAAKDDYAAGIAALHPFADYFTVNVSSPNTPGLRALQAPVVLAELLAHLAAVQRASGSRVPVLVKLAPDLDAGALHEALDAAVEGGAAGVVLTNTTLARDAVASHPRAAEAGGLSGAPLFPRSLEVVRAAFAHLRGRVPIVGVGGIHDAESAWRMLRAGAALLQLYTAMVYGGPALPARLLRGLAARMAAQGAANVDAVVGADA